MTAAATTVASSEAALNLQLSKAKTALLLEHPFFGSLCMNMPFRISAEVSTAATNGKEVIFNPDFLGGLNHDETVFLVAHEIGHPMLNHIFRKGERDHSKWNVACDYVLNHILVTEKVGRMPKVGLYDDELYKQAEGMAEKVYTMLPDEDGDGPGDGPGGALDDCQDAPGEPGSAEAGELEAQWKVKVAQAAQAAKMMGKLSNNLERFVGDLLKSKVNWADVLRRFLTRAKHDERTFARPNRRFAQQSLYLPSVDGERMGPLVFAIDCSGSVTDEELAQYASELRAVHEELRPSLLSVIYFDHDICHVDTFGVDDTVEVKPRGGGGTAFSPIFEYVEREQLDPVACVVLTDLCCYDFGDEPGYPVLWVSNDRDEAPFGEVVKF